MPRVQRLVPFLLLAMAIAGGPSVASDNSALHRLRASVQAAAEDAPPLAASRERISAEAALTRSELAAGTPSLEVQREGIGGGFSHQPNSASYLRLVRELRYPWMLNEARTAVKATDQYAGAATTSATLSTSAETARRWLEVAAATDQLELIERRRSRLSAAVRIQQTRYDVGEVSGSDLLQLQLEHAAVEAEHSAAQRRLERFHRRLELLCGDRCAPPEGGDLATLTVELRADPASFPDTSALEQSPRWTMLQQMLELEQAQTEIRRREAWGRPEADVEWEHVPSLAGEPSFDALGVRLSVPLPLGTAGREARAAADAMLRAAQLDARARQDELTTRLESSLTAVRSARISVRLLDGVLEGSTDAEHSLAEQFRLGAMTYLAYIDGLSRLEATRSSAIENRLELLSAHVDLYDLLGDLAPLSLTAPMEAAR